jgi:hypothetical protein
MNDARHQAAHFMITLPVGSEPFVEADDAGCIRIAAPLGGIVSGSLDGRHICLRDGDVELMLECVNAVTVADLRWVEQHTITRVFDSVSHFIRFVGGGELRFAFSLEGDLLELSGEHVAMSISPDGETLVFQPLPESSGQGPVEM